MIAQFFEVETRVGHRDQYLELAASLWPALDAMGGCLFIDRFQSLSRQICCCPIRSGKTKAR